MPGLDQFVILFRPARDLPAVAQVTFEGNKVVPQNVLREAVAGPASARRTPKTPSLHF